MAMFTISIAWRKPQAVGDERYARGHLDKSAMAVMSERLPIALYTTALCLTISE